MNECETGEHECVEPATCEDRDIGYSCDCPDGQPPTPDGKGCLGISKLIQARVLR